MNYTSACSLVLRSFINAFIFDADSISILCSFESNGISRISFTPQFPTIQGNPMQISSKPYSPHTKADTGRTVFSFLIIADTIFFTDSAIA